MGGGGGGGGGVLYEHLLVPDAYLHMCLGLVIRVVVAEVSVSCQLSEKCSPTI